MWLVKLVQEIRVTAVILAVIALFGFMHYWTPDGTHQQMWMVYLAIGIVTSTMLVGRALSTGGLEGVMKAYKNGGGNGKGPE